MHQISLKTNNILVSCFCGKVVTTFLPLPFQPAIHYGHPDQRRKKKDMMFYISSSSSRIIRKKDLRYLVGSRLFAIRPHTIINHTANSLIVKDPKNTDMTNIQNNRNYHRSNIDNSDRSSNTTLVSTKTTDESTSSSLGEYQNVRRAIPIPIQYILRDCGIIRWISDVSVILFGIPEILKEYSITALINYLLLSGWNHENIQPILLLSKYHMKMFARQPERTQQMSRPVGDKISHEDSIEKNASTLIEFEPLFYGNNQQQVIHIMKNKHHPENRLTNQHINIDSDVTSTKADEDIKYRKKKDSTNVVIFVHGGAWGSGFPELYRLVAVPFLLSSNKKKLDDANDTIVCVVGYRTYPTVRTIAEQVHDINQAVRSIQQHLRIKHDNKHQITLMGHSSGAHLCSLVALDACLPTTVKTKLKRSEHKEPSNTNVERQRQQKTPSSHSINSSCIIHNLILLSGVYQIPKHYLYEKKRGVERFSPLAGIFGANVKAYSTNWKDYSPTISLSKHVGRNLSIPEVPLTNIFICHGMNDTTVPYTSSLEFYNALRLFQRQQQQRSLRERSQQAYSIEHDKDNGTIASSLEAVMQASKTTSSFSQALTERNVNISIKVIPNVQHAETVIQLMFGGIIQDIICDWTNPTNKE